jgi:hypothetical protein
MNIKAEPRRRLRRKSGYSIAETLLALLILLILSSGIAGGIAFAARQYNESVMRSEAKVLCSSLSNVLRGELSITGDIDPHPGDEGRVKVQGFVSPNYAAEGTVQAGETKCASLHAQRDGVDAERGELMLDDSPLLPSAAYSSYAMDAKADVYDDRTLGLFEVTVEVWSGDGRAKLAENTFEVIPLNYDPGATP